MDQIRFFFRDQNVKIQFVESGVCGCASEFDIAGIGVSVHEVAEKDKRPSPTVS